MQKSKSPVIKMYGIPKEIYRCVGCQTIATMLIELGISFEMKEVMFYKDSQAQYHYENIAQAAKYAGVWPSKRVTYPVVVIDEKFVPFKLVKSTLGELGYDIDSLD